jgi:hypothetical protein
MEVREFALKQDFAVRGNYPGMRTKSFLNDSIKKRMRDILYPFAGEIKKLKKIPNITKTRLQVMTCKTILNGRWLIELVTYSTD